MTLRAKTKIVCTIAVLSTAFGIFVAYPNGGRFRVDFWWTLGMAAVEFALFFAVPIWLVWAIWRNKRVSIQRKIFAAAATILFVMVPIWAVHGQGGWNTRYQALTSVIGVAFNGFFAVCLRPWMTRPLMRIFSDKIHENITTATVAVNGVFFIVFPFYVDRWQSYIQHDYPNFVSFLHKVFG